MHILDKDGNSVTVGDYVHVRGMIINGMSPVGIVVNIDTTSYRVRFDVLRYISTYSYTRGKYNETLAILTNSELTAYLLSR